MELYPAVPSVVKAVIDANTTPQTFGVTNHSDGSRSPSVTATPCAAVTVVGAVSVRFIACVVTATVVVAFAVTATPERRIPARIVGEPNG
jgi:hypothetical protein